jgi:NAD-binding of NADP-dependent 3-hydroxyisobutyrate dehydrogenase
MTSGPEDIVKSFQPYFDAIGSNTFYYGEKPGNSQVAKLVNNMILGITMNAVAEGLRLGKHCDLPERELLNLLKVSTGDSWVVRNWEDVSEGTTDTALAVLLKDLKASYHEGLKHNVASLYHSMPFHPHNYSIRWEKRNRKPSNSFQQHKHMNKPINILGIAGSLRRQSYNPSALASCQGRAGGSRGSRGRVPVSRRVLLTAGGRDRAGDRSALCGASRFAFCDA